MGNIYTFVSSDNSLLKEKILNKCSDLNLTNIVNYDCSEDNYDLNKIVEDLNTLSLFEDLKAVIINNPVFLNEKNSIVDKVFVPYLDNPNPSAYLFLGINNLDSLYKDYQNAINKKTEVVVYKDLEIDDFISIAKKELKEYGLSAKDSTIKELVLRSNLDYITFKNNLDLLITYKYGAESVDLNDVLKMINKEEEAKIYELADSIVKKDKRKIYDTYYSLINQNITNDKILNSIISKFITLLNVKRLSGLCEDKEISEILNLKDKQVYAIKKQAANFSLNDLKEKLNYFLELDQKVKTGQMNLEKDLLICLLK